MKEIGIYINKENKVVLVEIINGKMVAKYTGIKANDILSTLSNKEIDQIGKIGDNAYIKYDDSIITLQNPLVLGKRRELKPLIDSVTLFRKNAPLRKRKEKIDKLKNDFYKFAKDVDKKYDIILKKIKEQQDNIALTILAIALSTGTIAAVYTLKKNEENPYIGKDIDIVPDKIKIMEMDDTSNTIANIKYQNLPIEIEEIDKTIENEEENKSKFVLKGPIKKYNISLEFEDKTDTVTASITRENYLDIIKEKASKYGIDYNLILAIATAERVTHSDVTDIGGGTGLMQIQNRAWVGNTVRIFNFNKNEYETITITDEMIRDLYGNIEVGCMILQDTLRRCNYNILLGLQGYNMGIGSIEMILNEYCNVENKTKEEVKNNIEDIEWLEYRDIVPWGNPKYIEGVLPYVTNDNGKINTFVYKPDGSMVKLNINNKEAILKVH